MTRAGFAGVLATALIAAGCGSSGGGDAATGGGSRATVPEFAKNFKAPASGCGSYDAAMPADPDGVIAQLDREHQDALRGYADFEGSTIEVLKSRWSDWKPADDGPYTVAISWAALVSDFQVQILDRMKKFLEADENVGEVVVRTTGSNIDIAQQLQQYDSLVQSKPDLIILQTPSADSFNGPVQKAADQGIPTVTLLSPVPVDGAVNVDGNNFLGAADTASYLTRVLEGKGNVLLVRALAAAAIDIQVAEAWNRVFASCPGMKVAGEVFGGFSESQAKSEVLKFLSTHPQKLDGVAILAGMAVGTLQAFKQVGRPIPPAAELGFDRGLLGHWQQNDATYNAAAASLPPVPAARAVTEVAVRMLAGQGVKLNTLVAVEPVVNDANLRDWAEEDWTLSTPGTVSGAEDSFMPSDFIDGFFNKPADEG